MKFLHHLLLCSLILLFGCNASKKSTSTNTAQTNDHLITFSFLQMNDVYEITPLEGGKVGGMARVATLRKQLLKENKNLLTVHAGDFLNPSLIGTIKVDGKRLKGKQMIDVMNHSGIDLATFGNHEFDIKESELQERLNESEFAWTTCNTYQVCGERTYPFYKEREGYKEFASETYTWNISDADGTKISIGIFGVTLPVNQKDYVHYDDFYTSAKQAVKDLKQTTDVVIGLTHLEVEQDKELARQLEDIPLFMGGHDHHNMKHMVNNTVIAKADANVKSVYLHTITFNTLTKESKLVSKLIKIDESLAFDPEVQKVVSKWNDILMKNIVTIIPEPERVIFVTDTPLDGRDGSMRTSQTNLGAIITKAFYLAAKEPVDGALLNSGSVRIDDELHGKITALDIFRALPFGGDIVEVEMTGQLLKQLLDEEKKGNGAYLQRHKINGDPKSGWIVKGEPLSTDRNYRIAMTSFMLTGYDYDFLTKDNPGIVKISAADPKDKTDLRRDLRIAIADYLESIR
ncbi:MAG: bifunctional UDP-sugar hydrolase/5'-nucleotidase [Saprospiraceae bacterium]